VAAAAAAAFEAVVRLIQRAHQGRIVYALPEHFEDASEFRDRPSKAVLAEVRAGDLLLVRHHDLSS